MKNNIKVNPTAKIWRYMDFSKFVWLLQNEALWLTRSDLLGDPWEVSLSGEQLQLVISRHPPLSLSRGSKRESAVERAERILRTWRKGTFVNCWNMSEGESNALWKIYCKSTEGILIQTTYQKLDYIKQNCIIKPVEYIVPGSNKKTPTLDDLVTKKRPMFSYENEIRIYYFDEKSSDEDVNGVKLKIDIPTFIESIKVHPQAEIVFYETVKKIIEKYIPNFSGSVSWSDMRLNPPF